MISAFLIALGAVTASPVGPPPVHPILEDARQAIGAGRLDQAKLMIGNAIAAGESGPKVDRALADLAYAAGSSSEALVRYQQLLAANPTDAVLLERAGIAAFKLGDVDRATALIERATGAPGTSWRAWNTQGAIADLRHDWAKSDTAYAKAWEISRDHAEIANNRGWSDILRGDWTGAVGYLETAATLDPTSVRIANNLELARAALSVELPSRRVGETDQAWAARLNDAGLAAQLLGDRKRAIAAFSQALEASGSWYQRAANNLEAASSR